MKTKLSNSTNRALNQWTKAIDSTLKTGKGKYKTAWVSDLHDWKMIIKNMKLGNMNKAIKIYMDLDTDSRETVPVKIASALTSRASK